MEKKISDVFKCFLPSILIFGMQLYLSGLGGFLFLCTLIHNYTEGGIQSLMKTYTKTVMSSDFQTAVMLAYSVFALTIFGIWFCKAFLPKQREKRGIAALTEKPVWFCFGVVLLAAGMQYLCMYMMDVVAGIFPQLMERYETLLKTIGLTEDALTVPLLLYTVIFGPICEELAFRGLTMGYAKRAMSFWAANIVQALLFAAMHMNLVQGSYTFFMGLLLGYLVNKSGSLLMGIIIHIAFNAMGVLGSSLIVSGSNPMQVFLILFAALVATYYGFVAINKNIPKKVNIDMESSDNNFTA